MTEVVLADLELAKISGKTNVKGKSIDTVLAIVVRNNGDDAATDVTLIVTFPATTYRVSSTPAGQLVMPNPPVVDPNVPSGSNVVGATIIKLPNLDVGKDASVTVSFTMATIGKTILGGAKVGAFVYGSRPDSDGSNNAKFFQIP
jgi:hypothetical protein